VKIYSRLMCISAGVLMTCGAAQAASLVDLGLSNESVRVRYGQDLNSSPQGRKEVGVGVLYNTNDNAMLDAWFHITDEAGTKAPGLDASVGFKAYLGKTKHLEYLGLGIGGELLYRPVQNNRLLLSAGAHFAPNIVTFLDADNLWELNLRVGYEVLPAAIAYISYQNVRVNFGIYENEQVVQRSGQLGLELRF
jgi:hypothetical protein